MAVELNCPTCCEHFHSSANTRELLGRLSQDEAYGFLGDGETLEDLIYNHLSEEGELECPECGEKLFLNEENLGMLALSILDQW